MKDLFGNGLTPEPVKPKPCCKNTPVLSTLDNEKAGQVIPARPCYVWKETTLLTWVMNRPRHTP